MVLTHKKVLKKKSNRLALRPGYSDVRLNRRGQLVGPFGNPITKHTTKGVSRHINKRLAAQRALAEMSKKPKK